MREFQAIFIRQSGLFNQSVDRLDKDEATNFITRMEMLDLTLKAVSKMMCFPVYFDIQVKWM